MWAKQIYKAIAINWHLIAIQYSSINSKGSLLSDTADKIMKELNCVRQSYHFWDIQVIAKKKIEEIK